MERQRVTGKVMRKEVRGEQITQSIKEPRVYPQSSRKLSRAFSIKGFTLSELRLDHSDPGSASIQQTLPGELGSGQWPVSHVPLILVTLADPLQKL